VGEHPVRARFDHRLPLADADLDREEAAEDEDRPLAEGDSRGDEERAEDEERPAGEVDRRPFGVPRSG
jgi:hypothetical protein